MFLVYCTCCRIGLQDWALLWRFSRGGGVCELELWTNRPNGGWLGSLLFAFAYLLVGQVWKNYHLVIRRVCLLSYLVS